MILWAIKKVITIGYVLFVLIIISYFTIPIIFRKKDYHEFEKSIFKIEIIYEENSGFGNDRTTFYKFSFKDKSRLSEFKDFKYLKSTDDALITFISLKKMIIIDTNIEISLKEEIINNLEQIVNKKDTKYFYIKENDKGITKLYIYNEDLGIGYLLFSQI